MTAAPALVAAAVGVGAIHTLAPDHWMPFAALARAEWWGTRRTTLVTAACGLGHVTSSVALGLIGAWTGLEVVERLGQRIERVSGFLLVAFGVAYMGLALARRWRPVRAHRHGRLHGHGHGDAASSPQSLTPWTLFLMFAADPCVAVIPLMFASLPLGAAAVCAVVVGYETATIVTMVALVLPASAAASAIGCGWIDRWSDAVAGSVVAIVGVVVVGFGI